MKQIVEVTKGEIWAESNLVSRKMGIKHNRFMEKANMVIGKIADLREQKLSPKYRLETRNYRGRDFDVCLMSREFFSLVMMRFETQKAFEWQVRFNQAFYEMEKALLTSQTNKNDIEWTSNRLIGITARKEETDAIKYFIEYATNQGSKNAKHYYKHITNCTYKALGMMVQRHPKLRDEMNIYQISELMLAERLAATRIKEYMDIGRHYKDIYNSVKDDLINFANAMKLN